MKCKTCGKLQGQQHKLSCPVHKYRRPPIWVPNYMYDTSHEHTDDGWRTEHSLSSDDASSSDCS